MNFASKNFFLFLPVVLLVWHATILALGCYRRIWLTSDRVDASLERRPDATHCGPPARCLPSTEAHHARREQLVRRDPLGWRRHALWAATSCSSTSMSSAASQLSSRGVPPAR